MNAVETAPAPPTASKTPTDDVGTASTVQVVSPDQAEIERRLPEYEKIYRPENIDQAVLVRRMVRESLRFDRCFEIELSTRKDTILRAKYAWAEDRTSEAADLGLRIARRPRAVAAELRRGLYGCIWLYENWATLGAILETGGEWNDEERAWAFDLLGVDHEARGSGRTPLDPGDDVPLDRHLRHVVEREMNILSALIEGPMAELDKAARERVLADHMIYEDPRLKRVLRAERESFRNYMTIRKTLAAENGENREAVASDERPAGTATPCGPTVAEAPANLPAPTPSPSRPAPQATAMTSARPESTANRETAAPTSRDRKRRRALEKRARRREAQARRA